MGENRETIEAAARAIKARSQDDPRVWAPENWREIDLEYPTGQLVIRLRPAGDRAVDVEVFSWGNLLASERLRKYDSPTRLAELVEGVTRAATRSRDST